MTFIKAKAGPTNAGDSKEKFTVQYFDEQGNLTIRSGGTRTWRCNNPGALLKSSYAVIGKSDSLKRSFCLNRMTCRLVSR